MRLTINPKIIGVVIIFFSALAIITVVSSHLLTVAFNYESVVNGILGSIGGILLFLQKKPGLLLSRIWAALQIPVYISGSSNGINIAFYFIQLIFIPITKTTSINRLVDPTQSYTTVGVNLVGIIFLVLLMLIKPSKSK